jgi:hypothetical protein
MALSNSNGYASALNSNLVMKSAFGSMNSVFNYAHLNSQSFNAHYDLISNTLDGLPLHLIAVSETWFSDTNVPRQLPGYKLFHKDRNNCLRTRGGGVALFVANNIKTGRVIKSPDSSLTDFLFLELINRSGSKLLVGVVYNPPKINWQNQLKSIFEELSGSFLDVLILGDFNMDYLQPTRETYEFQDFLTSLNFHNTVNYATNFFLNSATLIDLIITNNINNMIFCSQISVMGISSHDLLFGSFDFPSENRCNYEFILTRKIGSINKQHLLSHAYNLPWDSIFNLFDVDEQASFFEYNIKFLLDTYAPLKRVKILTNTNETFKFSNKLTSLANLRDYYGNLWRRTRIPVNQTLYKSARKNFNKLLAKEKAEHDAKIFNPKLPSKVLFKRLRDIQVLNSKKVADLNVTADELNNQFASNFRPLSIIPEFFPDFDGFSFSNVSSIDVSNAVHSIKSNAAGLDEIPLNFIKILLPVILPFLTFLINSCITKSTFPSTWKNSKIFPINKINSPTSAKDFRPINVIPCTAKIVEVLLKNQIITHVESSNILTEYQSGFRSKHSTTSALLNITDDLSANIDNNKNSVLILLDFSKAFDVIPHSILLDKLKLFFNFSSSSLKFMKSFLSGRFQKVLYKEILSSPKPITSGIFQGSILGPILFSLFINDIVQCLDEVNYHLYADDLQIYLAGDRDNMASCIDKLNNVLGAVYNWSLENDIQLNTSKTQAIVISNQKNFQNDTPNLSINNVPVPFSLQVNNLGVIFDRKLSFEAHINHICSQVNNLLRRLWPLTRHMTVEMRKKLVTTLILPKFLYASQVYTGTSKGAWDKLKLVFNNCVRYVYHKRKFDHISHLSNKIMGVGIVDFLVMYDSIFLFKLIKSQKPSYLHRKLTFSSSLRTQVLHVPDNRTWARSNSFFVRSISNWNSLNVNLRRQRDVEKFRECYMESLSH